MMIDYENMTTPDLLQAYANFFRVHRNRVAENDARAKKLKDALAPRLTEAEYRELRIAEGHMDADDYSPDEFDSVILSLKERYAA